MAGRLTLSWVNKDQALVLDGTGGYEWVERSDPRVTEVRLLHEAGHVGQVSGTVEDNLLIQGDSYAALHALSRIPEYAKRYRGKVKLIYIDPPFNTGQAFEHYDDALEHSVWLTMMRDRLLLIRDLLAADGSVWVHLDDAEMHYCRVMMDEIFGRGNFVATVVWEKADSTRNDAKGLSTDHDYILVYAKVKEVWRPNRMARTAEMNSIYSSPDADNIPWFDGDPTAPGGKTHQGMVYAIQSPFTGELQYPARGRHWFAEQSRLLSALMEWAPYERRDIGDEAERAHRCGISKEEVRRQVPALMLAVPLHEARVTARKRYEAGSWPELIFRSGGQGGIGCKRYQPDTGVAPRTLWLSSEVGHNRTAKAEIKALFPGEIPFSTPKPEKLLQRIIRIATSPGDIVLDCFAGSGTTAAVAHKMGRKWVGVELSTVNLATFARPRLEKVVAGDDSGDTSKDVGWKGGGGFRVLTVGPSLYECAGQRVLLADWAKGDDFALAVAAQLGFIYGLDGPFSGAKGRIRLAVVDGTADDVVVKSIVSYLEHYSELAQLSR